jgi:photosystem II stability/assembly factor-like uncharacterized protein
MKKHLMMLIVVLLIGWAFIPTSSSASPDMRPKQQATVTLTPKPITPEPTSTPRPTLPPEPTSIPPNQVYLPLLLKVSNSLDTPTPTATPTNVATAVPTPSPIPFINHDFEGGHVGWQESSLQGRQIITSVITSSLSIPAHSGSWVAWLGGSNEEQNYIQQTITVPTSAPYLAYWYWVSSNEYYCGYDFSYVKINNQISKKYDLCYGRNTYEWTKQIINLTTFAGQSVNIQLAVSTDSSDRSNLIVDDVTFVGPSIAQIVTSVGINNVIFANLEASTQPIYSLDGGATWQTVATAPWGEESIDTIAMVFKGTGDLTIPARLLVGSGRYIYRSGAYGKGWSNRVMDCSSNLVSSRIIASPLDSTLLYLVLKCVDYGDTTVFTSLDSGLTWQQKPTPYYYGNTVNLIPSPVITSRVYATSLGTYVSQSDDYGQTWQTDSYSIDASTLSLAPKDADKMFGFKKETSTIVGLASSDAGKTWSRWNVQPCAANSTYPQLIGLPGALIVRCEAGLYRSTDGRNSWQKIGEVTGHQFLTADYGNSGRLLWARDDGFWVSDDQGSHWILKTVAYK